MTKAINHAVSIRTPATLLDAAGFEISEAVTIPEHPARRSDVPTGLTAAVRAAIAARYPLGLYTHQAEAIGRSLAGHDVCLATQTASGKTLVYQATALDAVVGEPGARVLVMCPARALVIDQLKSWKALAADVCVTVDYIDGSVPVASRRAILNRAGIVIMTPDVVHAWLMSSLADKTVQTFTNKLRQVVLDEAHVYDGAFGSNMAYLMRRLENVAHSFRCVVGTATIDNPAGFLAELTGRNFDCFDQSHDGSPSPRKEIILARPNTESAEGFEGMVALVRSLKQAGSGRFLAFCDSRQQVERIVSTLARGNDDDSDGDEQPANDNDNFESTVLPYRAGYEAEDRKHIQNALTTGKLRGVVSTSALELGIDIGEIDVVALLGVPPTMKAFWQRVGRAGRRHAGTCLMLDPEGAVKDDRGGLNAFLARPVEPTRMYLGNRFIQYSQALCAASEIQQLGKEPESMAFLTLPESFREMVANELSPSEALPGDLYALKQRAAGSPQHEFPLRNAVEQNFKVRSVQQDPLGSLSFGYLMREAYPGAVHYYMARPYRVIHVLQRKGEVVVRRERAYTTKPLSQVMVFPDLTLGLRQLLRCPTGFVAEADLQVSERVTGFTEMRGPNRTTHIYGPDSEHAQRPLHRFFETTGVCWFFEGCDLSASSAQAILDAYCERLAIQHRDLGMGLFQAKNTPIGQGTYRGLCIFDSTNGSLRLSQTLAERFNEIVALAHERTQQDGSQDVATELALLLTAAAGLGPAAPIDVVPGSPASGNIIDVVASGQPAMLVTLEQAPWPHVRPRTPRPLRQVAGRLHTHPSHQRSDRNRTGGSNDGVDRSIDSCKSLSNRRPR
jgi:DEAD/DEAH box helicase domain-containing protein